jgi:hypothetical protein
MPEEAKDRRSHDQAAQGGRPDGHTPIQPLICQQCSPPRSFNTRNIIVFARTWQQAAVHGAPAGVGLSGYTPGMRCGATAPGHCGREALLAPPFPSEIDWPEDMW